MHTTHPTTTTAYTRDDLLEHIFVSRAYLARACAWLGEATTEDDLRLARTFVESAIGEVNRWTYELEDCDAG